MSADVTATGGVVACAQPAAASVARQVFAAGGNAVDAAVAAMLALCVGTPHQVGLGGYGGALVVYRAAERQAAAVDFDSRAPLAFDARPYAQDPERARHGPLSISVPAVVAGLDLALRRLGTMPWRDVAAGAVGLAEQGVTVTRALAGALDSLVRTSDEASVRALLPDGRVPAVGRLWVQKDLAALLRSLGEGEGAAEFYRGDVARSIVKRAREMGGVLAEEDFTRYGARVVEPLRAAYRGYELFTPPPPAGGLTTLSILKTLEGFDLAALEPWGGQYFELFCEAAKLCWRERREHLGDPDFVRPPVEQLLSPEAARARAKRLREGPWEGSAGRPSADVHTANVVAIDRQRNLVSLTATQGETWGSRVAVPGLGLVLGHGMSRFTWPHEDPNSPNAPAPEKRMQHNMCPLVIARGGRPYAAVGMPGGTRIVTVTGQMVVSLIDFGATPAAAVGAPRVHTDGGEPLLLSAGVPQEVGKELELMGHRVRRGGYTGGPANVAVVDAAGDKVRAAAGAGASSVAATDGGGQRNS